MVFPSKMVLCTFILLLTSNQVLSGRFKQRLHFLNFSKVKLNRDLIQQAKNLNYNSKNTAWVTVAYTKKYLTIVLQWEFDAQTSAIFGSWEIIIIFTCLDLIASFYNFNVKILMPTVSLRGFYSYERLFLGCFRDLMYLSFS